MDSILVHRRTFLGQALGVGMLLLAKAALPVAARPVPPFQKGEPELFGTCRSIQDKYKEMEGQAQGAPDKGIREQIEADMKKLDLVWRSEGCQGEFGAVAIARIPPLPGQMGPNPVAPPSVGVVTGGGASSKKPKKPKKPAQVAPPPAGTVRVTSHPSGKRRRSGKR